MPGHPENKHRDMNESEDSRVRILLLYEDLETQLRGKRSLAELEALSAEKWAIGAKFWRRDLLKTESLRNSAANEAAMADIILISLHGTEMLPEEVGEWLSSWLARKADRPYALGILFDEPSAPQSEPPSLLAALEAIATEAGADLFQKCFKRAVAGVREPREALSSKSGSDLFWSPTHLGSSAPSCLGGG
jgi:hypothetical protein